MGSTGIKNFKPSKRSRYKQGYVKNTSCNKLFESQKTKPIIYRSSYELKFIQWCERSTNITHWGSECIAIDYVNPVDGKHHKYYPDFLLEMADGTLMLVEIKSHNQTVAPDIDAQDISNYQYREYVRNLAKWSAAEEFCKNNGIVFKIFTEKTISRL